MTAETNLRRARASRSSASRMRTADGTFSFDPLTSRHRVSFYTARASRPARRASGKQVCDLQREAKSRSGLSRSAALDHQTGLRILAQALGAVWRLRATQEINWRFGQDQIGSPRPFHRRLLLSTEFRSRTWARAILASAIQPGRASRACVRALQSAALSRVANGVKIL
jgi:hypothetical protein